MYLLDTNVVSELRKASAGTANPGLVAWMDTIPTPLTHLSVITLHELEYGVLLAERGDAAKGAVLRRWLDESVVPAFAGRMVPIDDRVARLAASLHVPDPSPVRDALIGATAMVHSMNVVTRNAVDYARFPGLGVIDPWS